MADLDTVRADNAAQRGQVTIRRRLAGHGTLDLVLRALDDLGIRPGDDFTVARAPLDTGRRRGHSHHDERETSIHAARDNVPRVGSQRWRALGALEYAGDRGLIFTELQATTGIDSMRQRLSDLVRDGYAEDSGRRRNTPRGSSAAVIVITPRGRDVMRARRREALR